MNETSAGPAPASNRRRAVIMTVAALGAAGIAAGAVLGGGAASGAPPVTPPGASAYLQPAVNGRGGFGASGGDGYGAGHGRYGGGATTTGTTATSAQQVGVVDIVSTLGYQSAEAAGTGMVLTSNGDVLTNNHVVDGATSISVTIVSSGVTYTATVVGTDPSADVAVLQLNGASGLATAALGTSPATVGEAVTAVGNAGGTGTLSAAGGTVSA
ncbi:MAG TPA: trypsin-like peptidase domain-containing protein, partial [Blastococcus sp.]